MENFSSRRTFAIISHPDAGKTTLTEKLLLFGGAIQVAGAIKARKEMRHTKSDWMEIEKERGISVTASVMTFHFGNCVMNLLDTPGHKDFSEDTYRTLTAVDSAVMVLDAAKGIEEQTRKLFEVCRLRDIPIITFINKMDREARHPFELLDEIEKTLALDVAPVTWPVGMGGTFRGCYNFSEEKLRIFDAGRGDKIPDEVNFKSIDDKALEDYIAKDILAQFREDAEMAKVACKPFDVKAYLEGHLTPVFFGSALNNFGVGDLLEALSAFAPSPRPQPAEPQEVKPSDKDFSAFVFKIQANMDKNHRDRIAFARICSGTYERGIKAYHVRSGKTIALNNPVQFMGRDRELAEIALPGDIIGIPNHGSLKIGDSLTLGKKITFKGIPSFAPELFKRARLDDPMRSKQLKKALEELCEEGVSQVFKPLSGSAWIIGAVGQLQFEVMAHRLQEEYGVKGGFEDVQYTTARWITSKDKSKLENFIEKNKFHISEDMNGKPTYLAPNEWQLKRLKEDFPDIDFLSTSE